MSAQNGGLENSLQFYDYTHVLTPVKVTFNPDQRLEKNFYGVVDKYFPRTAYLYASTNLATVCTVVTKTCPKPEISIREPVGFEPLLKWPE